jgi:hypothetical protein
MVIGIKCHKQVISNLFHKVFLIMPLWDLYSKKEQIEKEMGEKRKRLLTL